MKNLPVLLCLLIPALLGLPLGAEEMTAETVMAKHLEALGGAEGLQGVKSLKITGVFNFNGIDSPFTLYKQRPNLYRMEVETSRGTSITAFDGSEGWTNATRSGEVEAMDADRAARLLEEEADFDGPLLGAAEKGHGVELIGVETVDAGEAYHLRLTLKSGRVQEWWVSASDFTVAQKITTAVHRRAGEYQRIWYLMEYQRTEGALLPHYLEQEDRQHVRARTVEEVEVNPEIDPALFQRPAAESAEN